MKNIRYVVYIGKRFLGNTREITIYDYETGETYYRLDNVEALIERIAKLKDNERIVIKIGANYFD